VKLVLRTLEKAFLDKSHLILVCPIKLTLLEQQRVRKFRIRDQWPLARWAGLYIKPSRYVPKTERKKGWRTPMQVLALESVEDIWDWLAGREPSGIEGGYKGTTASEKIL
jgi:hypothetical protein